ncbi:MAG: hypothetical protein HPM95_14815 [Alphaproteobacteria bacterium]|nr:hypothetical protein [Alphaproteobacteria bacterium]
MTEPSHPPDPVPASAHDAAEFAWLARRSFQHRPALLRRSGGPDRAAAQGVRRRRQADIGRPFLNALNYCMLLPGPEAQQLATYCG